ncbi:hypothetical protein DWW91_16940 [Parabacteroides sp. AF17-3]|nr:hypothetical protein DWW91_16940 [Parabacteroides sp. AF17-3]
MAFLYHKEAWKLLIHYSELRYRQTPIEQIIRQQPTLYSTYRSIYNKRERSVVYHLCPTRNLAIFSSKDNILNAYISFPRRATETQRTASPLNEAKIAKRKNIYSLQRIINKKKRYTKRILPDADDAESAE